MHAVLSTGRLDFVCSQMECFSQNILRNLIKLCTIYFPNKEKLKLFFSASIFFLYTLNREDFLKQICQ